MSRTRSAVRAAGVVAFRPGREVLLVHRPKYDDWSFPKGKVERGEHPVVTAVRETEEETGLHVRLGPPLPQQEYVAKGRPKVVDYWTARVNGDHDVSGYQRNDEIDDVAWVPLAEAPDWLSYPQDRETLAAAVDVRRRTSALVVLRHGKARSRKRWAEDDRLRPLLQEGHRQADRVAPLLAAYDVTRVLTSCSTRCQQTVAPYADLTGREPVEIDALSEEGADLASVRAVVADLIDHPEGAVLCTHRPVLPLVFDALELRKRDRAEDLSPAEMLVVHLRKGRIVAVERHGP